MLQASWLGSEVSGEQEQVNTSRLMSYTYLVDTVFLLLTSPEVSFKREMESTWNLLLVLAQHDSESVRAQRIHNEQTLVALHSAYLCVRDAHKEALGSRVYLLDSADWGSTSSFQESVLAQACAMIVVILSRGLSPLPLPALFGYNRLGPLISGTERRSRRKCTSKTTYKVAQLSLLSAN
jgi:hypothetical protein